MTTASILVVDAMLYLKNRQEGAEGTSCIIVIKNSLAHPHSLVQTYYNFFEYTPDHVIFVILCFYQ